MNKKDFALKHFTENKNFDEASIKPNTESPLEYANIFMKMHWN